MHQNYHVQLSKTGNLDGTEGTATIFKTPVSNFRRQGKLIGAVPANVPALILNPTFTFASRHTFDQPVTTAPSALRAQKRLAKAGSRCPTVTWHAFVAWPKKTYPACGVRDGECLLVPSTAPGVFAARMVTVPELKRFHIYIYAYSITLL